MEIRIKGKENQIFSMATVKQINIYGNGKILFQIQSDYFEEYRVDNRGIYSSVYDGRPAAIILENEPVRAIKENLNRKDNYYKKYVGGSYSWENGTALYIHESEIAVEDNGEKLAHKTEEEKCYLHGYTLHFKHGAIMQRLKAEKILDAGPGWTIPDGGRWSDGYGTKEKPCYDTFNSKFTGESGVMKRWREPETIYTMPTKTGPYCRIEYSAARIRAREIADDLNKNRVFYKDVSFYEIEKLLKYYDLQKRGEN